MPPADPRPSRHTAPGVFGQDADINVRLVRDTVSELTRGITDAFLLPEAPGFCQQAVNIVFNPSRRAEIHPGSRLIGVEVTNVGNTRIRRPRPVSGTFTPIDGGFSFAHRHLIFISSGRLYRYIPNASTYPNIGREEFRRIDFGAFTRVFTRGNSFTYASLNNEVVIASGVSDPMEIPERLFLVYFKGTNPDDPQEQRGDVGGHYLGVPAFTHPNSVTVEQFKDQAGTDGMETTSAEIDAAPETRTYGYAVQIVRRYTSDSGLNIDEGAPFFFNVKVPTATQLVRLTVHPLSAEFTTDNTAGLWGDLHLKVFRTLLGEDTYYLLRPDLGYGIEPITATNLTNRRNNVVINDIVGGTNAEGEAVDYDAQLKRNAESRPNFPAVISSTQTRANTRTHNLLPPRGRYVAVADKRLFIGGVYEDRYDPVSKTSVTQNITTRVVYSRQNVVYAFPNPNVLTVDYPITGLGVHRNNCLIFTRNTAHRIEGVGTDDLDTFQFEGETGCVAPRSLQQTQAGVFYAGTDGFYHADGFRVAKISDHITQRYERIPDTDEHPNKSKIFAFYDRLGYRIYFFYNDVSDGAEHFSKAFVLDLLHSNEERDGGSFLQYHIEPEEGAQLYNHLRTKVMVYHKGGIFKGNKDGTVSKFTPDFFYHEVWDRRPDVVPAAPPRPGETNLLRQVRESGRFRRIPAHCSFISAGLSANAKGDLKKLTRISLTVQEKSSGTLGIDGYADRNRNKERFLPHAFHTVDFQDPRQKLIDPLRKVNCVTLERSICTDQVINYYQIGLRNDYTKDHEFIGVSNYNPNDDPLVIARTGFIRMNSFFNPVVCDGQIVYNPAPVVAQIPQVNPFYKGTTNPFLDFRIVIKQVMDVTDILPVRDADENQVLDDDGDPVPDTRQSLSHAVMAQVNMLLMDKIFTVIPHASTHFSGNFNQAAVYVTPLFSEVGGGIETVIKNGKNVAERKDSYRSLLGTSPNIEITFRADLLRPTGVNFELLDASVRGFHGGPARRGGGVGL